MTLPLSFQRHGFLPPEQLVKKYRRLLIGSEGGANTGKTEFALSAPGPGILLALDRGYESVLDNPEPPATRNVDQWAFKPIVVPLATQMQQSQYLTYWKAFYSEYLAALSILEARTVIVDGDSDSWELQTLAEFGKLTQIPPVLRTGLNASRRAMYARAWDSGQIIICTYKLKKQYETAYLPDGTPKIGADGKEVREWDGKSYERQGFYDYEYLFQIQLRHLYKPAAITHNAILKRAVETPQQWGIKIMMCKANRSLEGSELWGPDCCFSSLVQLVYPQIDLSEWGF